jgi:hypothetical protein
VQVEVGQGGEIEQIEVDTVLASANDSSGSILIRAIV